MTMKDYKPGDIIPPEDIVEYVFVKNRKVFSHIGITGSGKSTTLHYLGTGIPLPVNSTISQTSDVEARIDANGDVRIDTPGLRDNRQGLSNHTHLVNYLKFLERGQIELMSGIFLHVGTDTRDFDDVKQLGEFILGLVPNPVDYVVIIVNGSGGRNAVIDRLQQDGKDPIMLEAHLLRESQADYLLDKDGNEVADRFLVLGQGREQHNCDRLRDLGLPVEPFKITSCNDKCLVCGSTGDPRTYGTKCHPRIESEHPHTELRRAHPGDPTATHPGVPNSVMKPNIHATRAAGVFRTIGRFPFGPGLINPLGLVGDLIDVFRPTIDRCASCQAPTFEPGCQHTWSCCSARTSHKDRESDGCHQVKICLDCHESVEQPGCVGKCVACMKPLDHPDFEHGCDGNVAHTLKSQAQASVPSVD